MSTSLWKQRLKDPIVRLKQEEPNFADAYQAEIVAHRPSFLERALTVFAIGFGAIMLLVSFPLVLALAAPFEEQIEPAIAAVGYLSTMCAFAIAEVLLSKLHKSNELSVCSHLPVADGEVVRRIWKPIFYSSFVGLWYLLAINFGILTSLSSVAARFGIAILFACLQWGFTLSLGLCLVRFLPRWPHGWCAVLMGFAGLGGVVFGNSEIQQVLTWIGWCSPGGWVGDAMWLGILQQRPLLLLVALPALAVVLFLPRTLRILTNRFQIREYRIRQGAELRSVFAGEFTGAESGRMVPRLSSDDEVRPEDSEETVLEQWRHLEDSSGWTNRGWQERLVAGWLTPRERHLVTYLTGDLMSWSSSWNSSVSGLLVISVAIALGVWPLQIMDSLFFILYFVTLFLFGSSLLDSNPGLYMTKCSGAYVAHFANYPLSTGELSRIFLKLSFFKTCFLGVIAVPIIVFLGWFDLRYGYTTAAWFIVGMLSFSFWRLSFLLSGGFVTPRLKLSTLWIPAVLILLFMATLSSAAVGLKVPAYLIPALIVCAGSSIANWWFFKWLVDRGRTDLVTGSESVLGNQFWDGILRGQQQMEQQKRKQTQLKTELGPFWWLRRPFG